MIFLELTLLILLAVGQATTVVQVTEEELPAYETYNQAVAAVRASNFNGAITLYEKALQLKWDLPEAHMNIALLLEQKGDFISSRYHHELSTQFAKTSGFLSAAKANLAIAEMKNGRSGVESAVRLLTEAISIDPQNDGAMVTLSALYSNKQEHLKALYYLETALSVNSRNKVALMNMGNHYFRLSNFSEALEYYKSAAASTDGASSHTKVLLQNNMGQCYREIGDYEKAMMSFDVAILELAVDGDTFNEVWTASNIFAIKGLSCNWSNLERTEFSVLTGMKTLHSLYESGKLSIAPNSVVDMYTFMLQRHASQYHDLLLASSPLLGCPMIASSDIRLNYSITHTSYSKIRLGYLSYDWRDHPMGRLTSSLIQKHNQSRFFVVCFYFGVPDASYHNTSDYSEQSFFRKWCSEFVDLNIIQSAGDKITFSPITDSSAIDIIVKSNIDILVDLTAHTTGGRIQLSNSNAARLSVNYLGYPGTSGCSNILYNMVDAMVVPADFLSKSFSEKLVYLPGTYQSNNMPLDVPPCACGYGSAAFINFSSIGRSLFCCKNVTEAQAEEYLGGSLVSKYQGIVERTWICIFNSHKKIEPIAFDCK
jgi:protein O-GlcNAc transferase